MLGEAHYVVKNIDGDYANLVLAEKMDGEVKLVARALLPEGIQEGSKLRYECFQYTLE